MLDSDKELAKSDILSRLKKIEGQVKGIQKMIDEEKCCSDVMVQISAIRSAINKVGGIVMDRYIRECVKESISAGSIDEEIDDIIETMVKYVK